MIFGKTKLELKIGVFVFFGLLILFVFILSIGGFKTWASGYRVHFIFNFSNGVKMGAPVRFAGVDAGEVKKINFRFIEQDSKTKVDIDCWVKKAIRIPADSTIWVNTLGLLGEKYIEVIPGKDYNNCLAAGQELVGEDPMPMHEVTALAKQIGRNLDNILTKVKNKEGTVGKLLFDDKIYNELDAFVTDIRKHPWKLLIKTRENK